MAKIVAILATTHHPFFYRASTAPPESRPDFADEWVRKVEAYRETLTRARPDVLVMIGSDHFHQLFYDNMPQFLIGKAPFYDANYYNEEREFGLPRMLLKGHETLSAYLLRAGLDVGFDFAFSNELRVDHSITCPIITTRPQADLPIVPIYTNIFAPLCCNIRVGERPVLEVACILTLKCQRLLVVTLKEGDKKRERQEIVRPKLKELHIIVGCQCFALFVGKVLPGATLALRKVQNDISTLVFPPGNCATGVFTVPLDQLWIAVNREEELIEKIFTHASTPFGYQVK